MTTNMFSGFPIWLVVFLATWTNATPSPRPEVTLMEVMARPFAPVDGASPECLRDSETYFADLSNYAPWALQMYDASAKLSPGLLTGNIQQMGNYDECLQIHTGHPFSAQACTASIRFEILNGTKTSNSLDMKDLLVQVAAASNVTTPEETIPYEWTWCVPSSCNYSEISEALQLALDPLKVDGRLDFLVRSDESSCHSLHTDESIYEVADFVYIGLLALLGLIIFSSTLYDLHSRNNLQRSDPDKFHAIMTSFSLYTNGKSLLSTERYGSSISCLDGIRFISICWIIYGHTYYLEAVGAKINRSVILKMHENWSSLLVLNGNIVTDTFFLLSALLLVYTYLSKRRKESRWSLNIPSLYINRYLRLTPTYAIVVGFYATLFDKLGSGQFWSLWVRSNKLACQRNWWTNLLYINNYVNVHDMCMSQSWYLSVDMQLLWLSPIFLYPLLKFHRSFVFWGTIIVGLFASILAPFIITYSLRLTGTMLYYKDLKDVAAVYLQIYVPVYTRAGPYIIGLALGSILFKMRSYKMKIALQYRIGGWILTIAIGMCSILGPRGMYFDDHRYDRLEAAFYAGLHRHVFSFFVAWVIFACVNGWGGFINSLLSWKLWMPLSKLTYSAYLTHYIILLYNAGKARTTGTLSLFGSTHTFFGNLCMTMMLSFVVCICFEMPFMSLVRILMSEKQTVLSQTTPTDKNIIFGSTCSENGIGKSTDVSTSTLSRDDSSSTIVSHCVDIDSSWPIVNKQTIHPMPEMIRDNRGFENTG